MIFTTFELDAVYMNEKLPLTIATFLISASASKISGKTEIEMSPPNGMEWPNRLIWGSSDGRCTSS